MGGIFTGELSLRRFATLLFALPAGAEFWLAQGGPKARTQETEASLNVWHAVRNLAESFSSKPREVEFPAAPEWGYQEIEAAKVQTRLSKAQLWLERQKRRLQRN